MKNKLERSKARAQKRGNRAKKEKREARQNTEDANTAKQKKVGDKQPGNKRTLYRVAGTKIEKQMSDEVQT